MTCPVYNSAVFVLGANSTASAPPPPLSPPSPGSATNIELCNPIEELNLATDVRPNTPTPSSSVVDSYEYELETPDSLAESEQHHERLSSAFHVLNTEANALRHVASLYAHDRIARQGFNEAVEAITRHKRKADHKDGQDFASPGNLVIIGVGKSGYIAKKLVATFNSLGIRASFLHPTEALHGDLGYIGPRDTLLLVTYSGKTPELGLLMPHLDQSLPLIILTSHITPHTCELITKHRGVDRTILLPAPAHELETVSFGVSAPTTSTTVALAVGDALAITCAREVSSCVASVFARNHPGGAIGAAFSSATSLVGLAVTAPTSPAIPKTLMEVMVKLDDMANIERGPEATGGMGTSIITAGTVLVAAGSSKTGWVRIGSGRDMTVVSPARRRRIQEHHLAVPIQQLPWLVLGFSDCISAKASLTTDEVDKIVSGPGSLMDAFLDDNDNDDEDRAEFVSVVDHHGEWIGVWESDSARR